MKSTRFIPILSVILLAAFVFAGCSRRDDYYDPQPPPPVGYQYQFTEEFDNDTRGWAFDDPTDSAYALVTNNEYKFVDYSFTGGLHTAVVPTTADVDGNFLVQTKLESNYAMALIFGASNSDFGFSFFVDNGLQQFAIYNEGGNSQSFQTLQDWTQNNVIKTTGYNEVEIEQKGNKWYFYINGTQVASMNAKYLPGDQFGFMVLANTTGYADYLRVKW
jgi:hypothetical protein